MKNMLRPGLTGRNGGDVLSVTDCLNLRPRTGGDADVLVPAGVPRVVAAGRYKPVAADGNVLVVTEGVNLYTVRTDAVDAEPEFVAALPSAPLCAVATADGMTVMTDAGPVALYRKEGGMECAGAAVVWPAVTVRAVPAGKISVEIASDTFNALARTSVDAYRQLADAANGTGRFMQPVVARCRFADSTGSTLHVTPPVAVMLPAGAQLVDALRTDMASGATGDNPVAQAMTVYADTYRIEVRVDGTVPASVRGRVASMTVEVTDDIHPCDMKGTATVTHNRRAGADEAVITLPRNGRGVGISGSASAQRLLRSAVAHFDELSTVAQVIPYPFLDSAGLYVVSAPAVPDVADAADSQYAVLRRTARAADTTAARLTVPHGFTAKCAASNGGWTAWGNVTRLPYAGYSVADFAASVEPGRPWSGCVRVDFADGTAVGREISGSDFPLTVSPLLTYPDAGAVRLTVAWHGDGDGVSYGFSVALTPDPSRVCAVSVNNTQRPWTAAQVDAMPVVPGSQARIAMPVYVAFADADNPRNVRGAHRLPSTPVRVCAAHGSGGAWDFGRTRFYVIGAESMRLATLSADARRLSVTLLSARGVASPSAVVDAGKSVLALCGQTLVRLDGAAVRELPGVYRGDLLGYDSARGEILVGNTDDNEVRVVRADGDLSGYALSLTPTGAWSAGGGRVFAVAENGLCELTDCRPADTLPVRWQAWITPDGGRRAVIRRVTWMLKASHLSGSLAVERAWLTGTAPAPALIARMEVDGAVRSPLTVPAVSRAAVDIRLDMQASVSADFAMTYPLINNTQQ